MDPQLRFALVLGTLHTAALLAVWGVFAVLLRLGLAKRFQVAAGRASNPALARRSHLELAVGQLGFVALVYAVVYPLWIRSGGQMGAAWPSALELALHLVAFILIQDTIFYWSHRTLHRPSLYRRIHARHHYFRYVRVPVAEFAHPVENAINFVAFFAGPVLLGSPFEFVAIWVVLRMIETTEAHSGYAFTTVSSRHAFHHMYAAKGCYGSFISPWDRVCGTDRQWRAWRRAQREASGIDT